MTAFVSSVNQILSVLTVAGGAIIIISLVGLLSSEKIRKILPRFMGRNAVLFSFIVVLAATFGSLFYSEIAGFEPCKLCWFQRILMYPQTILLGLALLKNDKNIVSYTLWLSAVGAAIAGYHYLLQIGVAPYLSCSVTGYSVSCAQRFVAEFGYITIPMMALTAFSLTILFASMKKIYEAKNKN